MHGISSRQEFVTSRFSFVLREPGKAEHIAKCTSDNTFQAPFAVKECSEDSPNFSHILWRCGWYNADVATSLLKEWIGLFNRLKPDIVFLDHAPSAAVAAFLLDIPYLLLGNGFELPPVQGAFPAILHQQKISLRRLEEWDTKVNKCLARACKQVGFANSRLKRFQQIFAPQRALVVGSPILDHYGIRAEINYFEPDTGEQCLHSDLVISTKSNIFVYLNAKVPGLVASLRQLAHYYQLHCYVPGLNQVQVNSLKSLGINISTAPLDMDTVLAQSSLVICHGGANTLRKAVQFELASLLLPSHVEQAMMAFRLKSLGIAELIGRESIATQLLPAVHNILANKQKYREKIHKLKCSARVNDRLWRKDISDMLTTA